MEGFLYIFAKSVELFMGLIYIALLVRVIFPIFTPEPEGNLAYRVSFVLSEVAVAPSRLLLRAFNIGQNSPFDFSVLVACLLLGIVNSFLPVI